MELKICNEKYIILLIIFVEGKPLLIVMESSLDIDMRIPLTPLWYEMLFMSQIHRCAAIKLYFTGYDL